MPECAMLHTRNTGRRLALPFAILFVLTAVAVIPTRAQVTASDDAKSKTATPSTFVPPASNSGLRPFPINVPAALQLANVRALDIAVAAERERVAVAVLNQANVLWLPSLTLGGDYFRHDGQIQDTPGAVFGGSKSAMMLGV